MATIDELMKDKNPGEIIIIEEGAPLPFRPFFKAKGNRGHNYWYGMQTDGTFDYKCNSFTDWEIYEEPIVVTKDQLKDACTSNGRLIDYEFLWRYLSTADVPKPEYTEL